MTARPLQIFLGFIFILASALSLHAGLQRLPFDAWPRLPFDAASMSMDQVILAFSLMPRMAVAILAGAMLGLSGALFQQLLRNPIADPSTLGISAGAQLAIVISTLFFPSVLDGNRVWVALAGASVAASIVFLLGWRRSFEPVTMVVSGLLVGITAASLAAALTLAQGEYLMSLVVWNGGSLSQQDWSNVILLGLQLLAGLVLTALLIRPLTVLGLGDSGAQSLGLSLFSVRLAVAAVAVMLAAFVAAAVGLVSFIGLAAPALTRAFGVRRSSSVLFLSPLLGGLLLWFCDGLVQLVASTTAEVFPTGAVTALIGGPLLLWLLPKIRPTDVTSGEGAEPAKRRQLAALLPVLVLMGVLVFAGLVIGRGPEGWTMLTTGDLESLLPFRWPRLAAAMAAGGLLAMAGALLQRLTGNPMASPEVIGVSGGAGLGFAAAITIFPAAGLFELFSGAGIGAALVMILVLFFAVRRHLAPEKILLAGIAVSSLCSAVLSALLAIGDQRAWQILAWLSGSGSTATPASAVFLAIMSAVLLAASLSLTRWLTILPLGRDVPVSLGLPLSGARIAVIAVAGIATGAASLLVGPLSFVGLMAPHIALRAGFTMPRGHLLASFLFGAVLMALSDLGARTVTFPYELPLGLFAALAGAPYLIWLSGRR
ncbi:Iron(3+)-hydroxamate import system permease protein fhuB [Agrobacterium tumefaciens]|uniref:Fe(3+)-hydroxamate ABC transporter permease FhuB n=1 Tax=Agrobacterium tumefaciens TaxID=358 RepID=UPI001ADD4127|nr:Fe(3+)-hydroxamate ABC transporter permease FhuB [Agrobacterium tumefaciens]QTK81549.1 Iron(3+)-hydroxamate import system permease protein fhuB [Agrobacterium tumefaciens]